MEINLLLRFLANLFENVDSLISYGTHENEKIIVPTKYKFLFLHMYSSIGLDQKAYDTRLFPTNLPSTVSVKICGSTLTSGIVDIDYQSSNRILNIIKSEVALEVFGIY